MTCKDCEARRRLVRDALYDAKVKKAVKHAAKGVAEAVGLSEKTGADDFAKEPQAERKRSKFPIFKTEIFDKDETL